MLQDRNIFNYASYLSDMRAATGGSGQKSLEVLVTEREQMVDNIIRFMSSMLSTLGTMTHYEEFSDRTRENRHLNGFHSFDMSLTVGGHTIYGNEMALRYKGEHVFEVAFVGHSFDGRYDQAEVRLYVPGKWEQKLLGMVKNKEKLVADWKARAAEQKEKEGQRAELNERLSTERANLEKRAARLGL